MFNKTKKRHLSDRLSSLTPPKKKRSKKKALGVGAAVAVGLALIWQGLGALGVEESGQP